MLFNSILRVFNLILIHLPPLILFILICIFFIDPYIGKYLISNPEIPSYFEEIDLTEDKLIEKNTPSSTENDDVIFMFLLGASISAVIGVFFIYYFNS